MGKQHWNQVHNEENQKMKLCPECGKSVKNNLKIHLQDVHSQKKEICPYCNREFKCYKNMTHHTQMMHEKIPCVHCGKLFGKPVMQRHVKSKHTPNDQRK